MKSIICFILILTVSSIVKSQSSMVFDAGTNIDVGTGADICGDNVTINGTYSGNGTLCQGPLPVELSSFTASVEKKSVRLSWRTETEVNNYGFEVERSNAKREMLNEYEWEKISFVEGHGNSNSPKDYSYLDENPVGGNKFHYRLKQIDTDGKFEYSDVVEVELIPNKFVLYQNYPNPFNPSTNIKFSLTEDANVSIKIYNSIGELVTELINKEYVAGYHKIVFNASGYGSGVYFYRIEANKFTDIKKLILLK